MGKEINNKKESKEKNKLPTIPPMHELMDNYKVKKHKPQWYGDLIERLDEELKQASNFRSKVLILHLYVEYWINEIIRITYKNPKIIIDDDELGKFGNKVKLLKSRDFFDGEDLFKDLFGNLKQIQWIRNHYSHTLLMKDELDQDIEDRIKNMKMLYIRKSVDLSKKSFEERFLICALDTFDFLEQIIDYIMKMIPRPF